MKFLFIYPNYASYWHIFLQSFPIRKLPVLASTSYFMSLSMDVCDDRWPKYANYKRMQVQWIKEISQIEKPHKPLWLEIYYFNTNFLLNIHLLERILHFTNLIYFRGLIELLRHLFILHVFILVLEFLLDIKLSH